MGANNLADFWGVISFCCVVRGLCGLWGLTIGMILGGLLAFVVLLENGVDVFG